jgi:hypothetical protein
MSMISTPPLQVLEKPNTGLVTFIANESVALEEIIGTPNGFPRWHAFDIDSGGLAVFPAATHAAPGRVVGVAQGSALDGQAVTCLLLGNGISFVVAGAAITCGESVASDSNGCAVPGTGLGVALMAAAGSGDVIAVVLSGNVSTPAS